MNEEQPRQCFVVMPYGEKPFNDGSGRTFDFEKVYRVIMRRAIELAGLVPLRADEHRGSAIIHTDMFRDLRDQRVVLADLSMANPNVFYELGIRHVMASSGTVLMCCSDSELPFDIKLSRVVFYNYDGVNLDWEEAERVINELQFALEEAKRGMPDSPVHALLEQVTPRRQSSPRTRKRSLGMRANRAVSLVPFQELVADNWAETKADIGELVKKHRHSPFGASSLGFLCLQLDPMPREAESIADELYYHEAFDIANEIYEKLRLANRLDMRGRLRFASSISENGQTLEGIEKASLDIRETMAMVTSQLEDEKLARTAELDLTWCQYSLSGMYLWKWERTKTREDLEAAIEYLERAEKSVGDAVSQGHYFPTGRDALIHLRLLVMLRERDNTPHRTDEEQHRDSILGLQPVRKDKARDISYLRWYQTITLSDMGDQDAARRVAMLAYSDDAKIMNTAVGYDIGRRQYSNLRRLIERHFHVLRNPEYISLVSQFLLMGHEQY